MIQELIIGILFAGALFYLGRMVYRAFTRKEGCGENCGCGTTELPIDKIAEQLKKDNRFKKMNNESS